MGDLVIIEPNKWHAIADLPDAWKDSDIFVDLWVDQGRQVPRESRFVRIADCRLVQDDWMEISDTKYRPISGKPTHFMRVEGPQS